LLSAKLGRPPPAGPPALEEPLLLLAVFVDVRPAPDLSCDDLPSTACFFEDVFNADLSKGFTVFAADLTDVFAVPVTVLSKGFTVFVADLTDDFAVPVTVLNKGFTAFVADLTDDRAVLLVGLRSASALLAADLSDTSLVADVAVDFALSAADSTDDFTFPVNEWAVSATLWAVPAILPRAFVKPDLTFPVVLRSEALFSPAETPLLFAFTSAEASDDDTLDDASI
jgi:hypothetical protein